MFGSFAPSPHMHRWHVRAAIAGPVAGSAPPASPAPWSARCRAPCCESALLTATRWRRAPCCVSARSSASWREAASLAPSRPFCSDVSREHGEALTATASRVDNWILIEYHGAWGKDAVDSSVLSAELKTHLAECAHALRPNGLLVFTLEHAVESSAGYRLEPHGRYSHARSYVEQLLTCSGLHAKVIQAELRMEAGAPVPGLVIRAVKSV